MTYSKIIKLCIFTFAITFPANVNAEESKIIKELREKIAAAFVAVEKLVLKVSPEPNPEPKPKPVPTICELCKGTKVIIHGDGHRTPCPNCTGDEKPKNLTQGAKIIVYTLKNCGACIKWKNENNKKLIDVGWEMIYHDCELNPVEGITRFPTFDIYSNGKITRARVDYLTMDQLREINNKHAKSK